MLRDQLSVCVCVCRLKLFLEQFSIKTCVLNSELPNNSRYVGLVMYMSVHVDTYGVCVGVTLWKSLIVVSMTTS